MSDQIVKVHHLNCATLCPVSLKNIINNTCKVLSKLPLRIPNILKDIGGKNVQEVIHEHLVCHCLLIETKKKLILMDTGLGRKDVQSSGSRLPIEFLKIIGRPLLKLEETAYHQIIKLGYSPDDLTDILVTHLDVDHVGGLADFPQATVHLLDAELDSAINPKSYIQKHRYLAKMWDHNPKWKTYRASGEKWNDFYSVKELEGLPSEIKMIPLRGHTQGHCGLVIEHQGNSLFFTGDAYISKKQLQGITPFEVLLFNKLIQEDINLYRENLERIIQLKNEALPSLSIFCSHDPDEYHHLSNP
ncbi:MAG: MBL fold metallo-hydrolase [Halobacteriovoraceae bacterium]|jgi:glyoxylase-like metal-dependent hydrolase (beta-lactamase superfamily II)|nr:MBL fold metallo-hydrolase [Halobacteriovoraceae bacterium]